MLEDCAPHSSSSLLGESSSSVKNQSLSESEEEPDRESWMITVLEWWDLLGVLKVLGVVWPSSLPVVPMQCSVSCWSKTGYGPWNSSMSDVSGRSGMLRWGVTMPVGCVMA